MLRFAGVVPLDELTNSQFEPPLVLPVTEKVSGVPSVLVTARFWKDEAVEPTASVKLSVLGLKTRSAVLLTTSVTGIVWGTFEPPPVGVMVIVPL